MSELNYEFRKRMLEVHTKNRRMPGKKPGANQVEITDEWQIAVTDQNEFLIDRARDLEDYFFKSMGVQVRFTSKQPEKFYIKYAVDKNLEKDGSYVIEVTSDHITITGKDNRAAGQGGFFLEDLMNLEEAPYLDITVHERAPRFRTRMIHSGYSIDNFPDQHLNAIAHYGITAILVFTKDVNLTTCGYIDFNELIYRAAKYGIDVYAYSYYRNEMHPEDEGAEEYYEARYGRLFRLCPDLKGIIFVGESIEFPSRDERTCRCRWRENRDENGNPIVMKPSPGWFPCNDFPDWLNFVKKIIRSKKPDADIVFWTYNWGYVKEELRTELINNLPTDISLQATFEMFEKVERDGVKAITTDYSIFEPGPGHYFTTEAKAASERGIPLYSMTNAGGLTWDIGTIPYEPVPYQWLKRYNKMIEMNEKYGLCGSMDSHHFGFYPSFISELAKWCFWTPYTDGEEMLARLTARDWGKENTEKALSAYRDFSDAINLMVSTNEDQYGPLRIGPSYPLILFEDEKIEIPSPDYAHFGGNHICDPTYPYDASTPEKLQRLEDEIRLYTKSCDLFMKGAETLFSLLPSLPEAKYDHAKRIAGLGEFMGRAVATARNVKEWHKRKVALSAPGADKGALLDQMAEIAKIEIENAQNTIPLVDFDSRLGYEPSMEYMCDREHLEWKINVVTRIINEEIPDIRKTGKVKAVRYSKAAFAGGRVDFD